MLSPYDLLRRFVINGLRDTVASYADRTLPLHRFAWELNARISTLSELTGLPHWRLLASMRGAERTLTELAGTVRAEGWRALTRAETRDVATAVATLRATLAQLTPVDTGQSSPGLTVIPAHVLRGETPAGERAPARRTAAPTSRPRAQSTASNGQLAD